MISIVICTLNEQNYLPKLLDSIKLQTELKYEVIVVDAGSEDRTEEVAKEYLLNGMPLNFISSKGVRNISAQRNIGARNAQYERLLFLDADVVLPNNFLVDALNELSLKNITVAGTKIYAAESQFKYRYLYWNYSNLYMPLVRVFKPIIHGCSIFSTKAAHNLIGGFNEGLIFEDYRYGVDAGKHFKVILLKKAYVKTSARRFYNNSFRGTMELLLAGGYSFFRTGIKGKYMKTYHEVTGNHSEPKY